MVTGWCMPIFVASKIPWSRVRYLYFQKPNQNISNLFESHINLDKIHQIHNIRNNCLGLIFFFVALFHLGYTDQTNQKKCVFFKIVTSNDRVFCVYAPPEHSIRKQLTRGRGEGFFEELKYSMENKNRGNEKKTFGNFNCIMDKMGRDSGKKAQIIYRRGSKLGSSSYEKRRT